MNLNWQQAPVKTQWGAEMVVASVAIDKDHTLDLYCERDQTKKVEAMFTQRTWVGLTDEEINNSYLFWVVDQQDVIGFGKSLETKIKRKNT